MQCLAWVAFSDACSVRSKVNAPRANAGEVLRYAVDTNGLGFFY